MLEPQALINRLETTTIRNPVHLRGHRVHGEDEHSDFEFRHRIYVANICRTLNLLPYEK